MYDCIERMKVEKINVKKSSVELPRPLHSNNNIIILNFIAIV